MLKIKKGFLLIESLVALFVLSMITLVYINSSAIFFKSQTDLIKSDRKDQLADLILQENSGIGTITTNGNQNFNGATAVINLNEFATAPVAGDILLVNNVSKAEDVLSKNIVTFQEILERPDNLQLNLLYAKQQEKVGKFKNVIATLERLNLLYPENYDIKLYLLSILIRNDSKDRALEVFNDLSEDPNLTNDIRIYIENLIKDFQVRIEEAQKKENKKTLFAIDVYMSGNEHSNVAGVSKSNTFYLSDSISNYAATEIQDDVSINRGINATVLRELNETSSIIIKGGFNNTKQDKGAAEENDLVSFSLIYNKQFGKNFFSPYLVYSRPNYRTQNDANTSMIGLNGRYVINPTNSLNYGFSSSENKFDQTSTFTTASNKNNTTYSGNVSYQKILKEKNLFNINLFAKDIDANVNYNSYYGYGSSLSYSRILPVGILSLEKSYEQNDYEAPDSFYNSSIIKDEFTIRSSVSLNGLLSQIPLLRIFDKDGSFFYSLKYLETNTNSNMLNYDTIKENITYGITKRFNF
ncbi:DUF2860 domain-containing protein [Candidatus Pelagibacter ubique]|nr:DUF2860 domain-containing protein [Candidatus Pelagibacter ubique]MDA7490444.1 DUF2860 domain-containing protein [Candidatus Pelagibacter ubique]MDB9757719.1 DUF2860 domain-containing protein [Candidatus Pelagibacter ubique]